MTNKTELEIILHYARALCARRGIDADAIVDPVGPVREFDREA